VFVALGIQHAMRMRSSHLWPAQLYNIFFSILTHNWHDFRKKKKVTELKMRFDFLNKFCLKHFSFYEEMGEI
jgi:hypothetical protein